MKSALYMNYNNTLQNLIMKMLLEKIRFLYLCNVIFEAVYQKLKFYIVYYVVLHTFKY